MLVDGVNVEYKRPDGSIAGTQVRVLDFDAPENNDWLAVNQFTVIEKTKHASPQHRRPDIVLFVNGLPLVVIELKNPADENATIWTAWNQIRTYKNKIPSLFAYNEALVISDGVEARIGTLTATPCTSTSPCAVIRSCRPSRGSTASSATKSYRSLLRDALGLLRTR